MKTPKKTSTSKHVSAAKIGVCSPAARAALSVPSAKADISWQGPTADYTTAADWVGGVVPGAHDNALNDNGLNNSVQISVGNPGWPGNQRKPGNAGNGSYIQNGQAVTLLGTNLPNSSYVTPFRIGIGLNNTGMYTLNGGAINYSNGGFNIGEFGTGVLNMSGGTITGSGNFAVNLGTLGTPVAVNATVGGDVTEADFTWFERGFYTPDSTIGLPAANTTFTSVSQSDHTYITAPSYTTSDVILISTNVQADTVTLSTPTAASALSLVGSAGNGPVTVNYVIHHADSTQETGSVQLADWFGSPSLVQTNVLGVGGRVDALGVTIQTF